MDGWADRHDPFIGSLNRVVLFMHKGEQTALTFGSARIDFFVRYSWLRRARVRACTCVNVLACVFVLACEGSRLHLSVLTRV